MSKSPTETAGDDVLRFDTDTAGQPLHQLLGVDLGRGRPVVQRNPLWKTVGEATGFVWCSAPTMRTGAGPMAGTCYWRRDVLLVREPLESSFMHPKKPVSLVLKPNSRRGMCFVSCFDPRTLPGRLSQPFRVREIGTPTEVEEPYRPSYGSPSRVL